jgi:hypothetical protein
MYNNNNNSDNNKTTSLLLLALSANYRVSPKKRQIEKKNIQQILQNTECVKRDDQF